MHQYIVTFALDNGDYHDITVVATCTSHAYCLATSALPQGARILAIM